jgi:GNAT superfamily N-acetyltransferase
MDKATDARIANQMRSRWRALDPLLPAPLAGRGEDLVAPGDDAVPMSGRYHRTTVGPDSPRAAWGPRTRFELTPRVAGADHDVALDRLLTAWGARIRSDPAAQDPDSGAVLSWPSRDTAATRVLLAHGLQPRTAVLVRRAGTRAADRPTGTGIRPARPGDLDAIAALHLEVLRYDADCGLSFVRPGALARLREAAAARLGSADRGIWVAEHDGDVAGFVTADAPASGGWLTGVVAAAPASYVGTLGVTPSLRGRGIGAALAGHAHQWLDAAGSAATVLHAAVANPLSTPFWAGLGYRPLWFEWRVQPACALR